MAVSEQGGKKSKEIDKTPWLEFQRAGDVTSSSTKKYHSMGNTALQWSLECGTCSQKSWVQIPGLPLPGCVSLSKLLNCSVPQFLHMSSRVVVRIK